jgi:hypothetical protein
MTRRQRFLLILPLALAGMPAWATEPTQGYYAGEAILYPYKPVYCDADPLMTIRSACYGLHGDLIDLPKSAPLPHGYRWCEWADDSDPKATAPAGPGWVSITGEGWYQWEPRDVPADKQRFYGAKVCYLEDRGTSKNIGEKKE